MRKFLGFLIVVELLAAAVYFAGPSVDDWLEERLNPTLQAGPVVTEPPQTTIVEVLRPGQSKVTGTLTRLVAKDVAADPIPTPFTVEAGERGVTRAVIDNVLVDRRPSSISWDGGRPLPITGTGGIELGSAQLTADANGLTWALEGSPRGISSGTYRANFTVAVGSGGVASVREGVNFTATADSALEVTKGGAFIRRPAQAIRVRAATSTNAILEGTFTITTADGERPAKRILFGPGLYDITLTPAGTAYTITAILQGPLQ